MEETGSYWEICLFAVAFVLVFSAIANAGSEFDSDAPAVAAQGTLRTPVPGSSWAGVDWSDFDLSTRLSFEVSRMMTDEGLPSYGGAYHVQLQTSHEPTQVNASLDLMYTQEYSYERDDGSTGSLENPGLSIDKTWRRGQDFSAALLDRVNLGLRASVAASPEARRRTFRGSVGPALTMTKVLSKLILSQALSYSRGFYEYETRDDGTVNSPDVMRSSTSVTYLLSDAISLVGSFTYSYALSYQGVGRADEQSMGLIGYQANERVDLAFGFASGRRTLGADGQTESIRFLDERGTQFFFEIGFVI